METARTGRARAFGLLVSGLLAPGLLAIAALALGAAWPALAGEVAFHAQVKNLGYQRETTERHGPERVF